MQTCDCEGRHQDPEWRKSNLCLSLYDLASIHAASPLTFPLHTTLGLIHLSISPSLSTYASLCPYLPTSASLTLPLPASICHLPCLTLPVVSEAR
ncbi:hypothetical protein Pmani_013951 [Petrolisthes manimaculis]|uniref:Uncharacterized protein n=1 Tax=Petrolisthes manimaculis TaxID=1843537 RepID=A0AAE1PWB3_9EUCA|nr:hypothetical protein Pmani_013951 [Petrolisthes manimaculis]